MNKKLIIGVSAAAVAAVVIGAAAALMTSSTPEKIDLSTTHTTEAPSESAKEPETTSAPETTAPETTASSTASVTSSLETYTSGNISIQYPQVSGLSDSKLQDSINENLKNNALSVITGYEADEAKDKDGNELFLGREKYAIFRDLGLFLFMYLGNGQNLADTLRLTYDELYYATHGKQLRFLRHKTRERNESASEVIFPVTPEIQEILNRYGNVPKLGRRVFPIMSELITPEQEIWVIQRYNRYIREHMAKVAKLLDMEQVPSPTWARHSFATNLNNSGVVPYKYISDSMGHSGGGDITSNYIGAYPLAKMLEYNHYLLNEKSKESTPVVDKKALLEMLKGLSEEERTELMANLSD